MDLSQITFLLFAAFSSLRMVSYLPQIYKVATDKNGASAISYSTWGLWVAANVTTGLYALNNLHDRYLATVSGVYAVCCIAVIGLTILKRRRHQPSHAALVEALPRLCSWQMPVYGVATVGMLAIAIGLGGRWLLPGLPPVAPGSDSVPVSEVAVADTPFDDEPVDARAARALVPVLVREAQARTPAIRFEASYQPKAPKAHARQAR